MGFVASIQTCFSKYATFSGRAPRSEFWWFALFIAVGATISAALDTGIFPTASFAPVTGLFQIATLLPLLAVGFRRMHDTERPGWLIFLPIIVSVAFVFLSVTGFARGPNPDFTTNPGNARFVVLGILQIVAAFFILWWLTRPGQPHENAYGPNPHQAAP